MRDISVREGRRGDIMLRVGPNFLAIKPQEVITVINLLADQMEHNAQAT